MKPVVSEGGDGSVWCEVTLPVPADQVRSSLADPLTASRFSPDVLDTQVQERGNCDEVLYTTRGVFSPLTLRALRCPTRDGFAESLLESSDFSDFHTEWTFNEVEGGTRVRYRVRSHPNVPVPDILVKEGMKHGVKQTMEELIRHLLHRRNPGR